DGCALDGRGCRRTRHRFAGAAGGCRLGLARPAMVGPSAPVGDAAVGAVRNRPRHVGPRGRGGVGAPRHGAGALPCLARM
ncbi:MAG: hypothetical protein AVDCRST_MAG73-3553, partial [uncultured Thermomicrobiales bacterium]